MGIFASKEFQTTTICIGNLSVGGTGKTPMIESLVVFLKDNYTVAVLSRGYKRKSKGHILATSESTFEELGDEPFQVYAKFPNISVAVNADRSAGISQLEKDVKPDVILLDDAFQHRKVKADFNILLTTYDKLYINDWYLPTGNLRDGKSQAGRADYVIVTKCPREISSTERQAVTQKLGLKKGQEMLFSYLKYDRELHPVENSLLLSDLKNVRFTLVTGIADPEPLVRYLTEENLTFEHLAFADHHFFTPKELEIFNSKVLIVTTEKDYVRLKGKVENLRYINISHAFLDGGDTKLKSRLRDLMRQGS